MPWTACSSWFFQVPKLKCWSLRLRQLSLLSLKRDSTTRGSSLPVLLSCSITVELLPTSLRPSYSNGQFILLRLIQNSSPRRRLAINILVAQKTEASPAPPHTTPHDPRTLDCRKAAPQPSSDFLPTLKPTLLLLPAFAVNRRPAARWREYMQMSTSTCQGHTGTTTASTSHGVCSRTTRLWEKSVPTNSHYHNHPEL